MPSDLLIFSPAVPRMPLCTQYWANPSPTARDWASSFSWCGNTRSRPPPWMSNVGPRYLVDMAEHSRCQPGRPGPHGVSQEGSPGLAPFQRAKSRGSRLASAVSVSSAGRTVFQSLPGQRAVGRPGTDVEVHIAARGVGVPAGNQPPHQRDHLRDMARGPRFHVRREAAEDVIGAAERALVALRHGPPGDAFGGRDTEDLVVDVGDVPAERDLVAAGLQPADQDVEAHPGPDVPDVRRGLHGGATQVQRCLPRLDRGELALGARCCVIEAERHAAKATAAATGRRSI